MATEIEFPKAKEAGLSKQPGKQYLAWLITRLARLAMARQATVDKETLAYFASELAHHEPNDLSLALEKISHTKRETGETAFPDLPTIEEEIREFKNKRLAADRKERELQDEAIRAKHMAEHPEEYVAADDFIRAVLKQWEAKRVAQKAEVVSTRKDTPKGKGIA